MKFSYDLLTLIFFQIMSLFLLLNTKEDVLKRVGKQTVDDSQCTDHKACKYMNVCVCY